MSKDVKHSEELDIRVTSNLLHLVNDFTGETELISLFLMPEHRTKYAGQFTLGGGSTTDDGFGEMSVQ
jgi:arginine/ornithine N-succinyltransferase beta subunit